MAASSVTEFCVIGKTVTDTTTPKKTRVVASRLTWCRMAIPLLPFKRVWYVLCGTSPSYVLIRHIMFTLFGWNRWCKKRDSGYTGCSMVKLGVKKCPIRISRRIIPNMIWWIRYWHLRCRSVLLSLWDSFSPLSKR